MSGLIFPLGRLGYTFPGTGRARGKPRGVTGMIPREKTMLGLGPMELVIIIVIALVIFGPSRLPKVGQSIGEMVRNFRQVKGAAGKVQDDLKREVEDMVLGPPEGDDATRGPGK